MTLNEFKLTRLDIPWDRYYNYNDILKDAVKREIDIDKLVHYMDQVIGHENEQKLMKQVYDSVKNNVSDNIIQYEIDNAESLRTGELLAYCYKKGFTEQESFEMLQKLKDFKFETGVFHLPSEQYGYMTPSYYAYQTPDPFEIVSLLSTARSYDLNVAKTIDEIVSIKDFTMLKSEVDYVIQKKENDIKHGSKMDRFYQELEKYNEAISEYKSKNAVQRLIYLANKQYPSPPVQPKLDEIHVAYQSSKETFPFGISNVCVVAHDNCEKVQHPINYIGENETVENPGLCVFETINYETKAARTFLSNERGGEQVEELIKCFEMYTKASLQVNENNMIANMKADDLLSFVQDYIATYIETSLLNLQEHNKSVSMLHGTYSFFTIDLNDNMDCAEILNIIYENREKFDPEWVNDNIDILDNNRTSHVAEWIQYTQEIDVADDFGEN